MARISADASQTQGVIDHFKQWLPKTNKVYEDKLRHDQEVAERKEREKLQRRIQQEQERANVIQNLKF